MEFTPLSRFRKFISRVSELSTAYGDALQLRGFKTGGTAGQVPVKTNGTDFNWSWGTPALATTVTTNANLTGVVTSVGNATSIADGALNISKTNGLQTALDGKATLASPTFTGTIRLPGYTVSTLPVGTVGQMAYVTDATTPTYNSALTGGGAVVVPVFFNGSIWVSH